MVDDKHDFVELKSSLLLIVSGPAAVLTVFCGLAVAALLNQAATTRALNTVLIQGHGSSLAAALFTDVLARLLAHKGTNMPGAEGRKHTLRLADKHTSPWFSTRLDGRPQPESRGLLFGNNGEAGQPVDACELHPQDGRQSFPQKDRLVCQISGEHRVEERRQPTHHREDHRHQRRRVDREPHSQRAGAKPHRHRFRVSISTHPCFAIDSYAMCVKRAVAHERRASQAVVS